MLTGGGRAGKVGDCGKDWGKVGGGWGRVVNYRTDWGKVQERAGKGGKGLEKLEKSGEGRLLTARLIITLFVDLQRSIYFCYILFKTLNWFSAKEEQH